MVSRKKQIKKKMQPVVVNLRNILISKDAFSKLVQQPVHAHLAKKMKVLLTFMQDIITKIDKNRIDLIESLNGKKIDDERWDLGDKFGEFNEKFTKFLEESIKIPVDLLLDFDKEVTQFKISAIDLDQLSYLIK